MGTKLPYCTWIQNSHTAHGYTTLILHMGIKKVTEVCYSKKSLIFPLPVLKLQLHFLFNVITSLKDPNNSLAIS
jgi:hypothetical protein